MDICTKGDSAANCLVASRFKVPTAFVSKSSNGMPAALSCEGCAAVCTMASGLTSRMRSRIPTLSRISSSWCLKLFISC